MFYKMWKYVFLVNILTVYLYNSVVRSRDREHRLRECLYKQQADSTKVWITLWCICSIPSVLWSRVASFTAHTLILKEPSIPCTEYPTSIAPLPLYPLWIPTHRLETGVVLVNIVRSRVLSPEALFRASQADKLNERLFGIISGKKKHIIRIPSRVGIMFVLTHTLCLSILSLIWNARDETCHNLLAQIT